MQTVEVPTHENKTDDPEYFKKYYASNREAILKHKLEKVTCECGTLSSRGGLPAHKRTEKHRLRLLASKLAQLQNI